MSIECFHFLALSANEITSYARKKSPYDYNEYALGETSTREIDLTLLLY